MLKRVLISSLFLSMAVAAGACNEQSKAPPANTGNQGLGGTASSQPSAIPEPVKNPDQAGQAPVDPPKDPLEQHAEGAPAGAGNPDNGKKLYAQACQNCHGPDGTGAQMRQMLPKIGDLTSSEMHARMKDADIATLITNGRDKMPPFGSIYKPNQIADIISYVRTLQKKS